MLKRKIMGLILVLAATISVAVHADSVTITEDTLLTPNSEQEFAGIYEYEDLTITGGNLLSSGVSQIVLRVTGTLTIGDGAAIRVRNGFYPEAPENQIADINEGNLNTMGISRGAQQ